MATKPTYEELEQRVKELKKEAAEHKKTEEVIQNQVNDLGERVKELDCLYGISMLIEKPDISLEEILQGAVNFIPPAWQYPEITCARIILEGKEFGTENFRETTWKQAREIRAYGKTIGTLEVYCLEERAKKDKEPFLKEEWNLLTMIAERLGHVTERKRAEKRIKHLNQVLRAIRNVNQLIAKEKDRDRLLKGACDNLTQTRGYHNAWIALLDANRDLVATAESGLGKDFLPMVDWLKAGTLTDCGKKALRHAGVVITQDPPPSSCTDCPLSGQYGGRGAMTVRLEHDGKIYGIASTSTPIDFLSDEEEQSLFQEVAIDIAFALHNIELEEKHKHAEDTLKESEERYRGLFDRSLDFVYVHDFEGNFIDANPAVLESFGYTKEDISSLNFTTLLSEDQIPAALKVLEEIAYTGFQRELTEYRLKRKDGTYLYIETKASLIYRDGKPYAIQGIARDITSRKQAEEQIQASLKEKEVLLKEIHHRVKNNMQVIASMLSLQSQHIKDKDSREMFQESQDRVRSMALVHESLYTSEDLAHIDIAKYIHSLTHQLITSYRTTASRVGMNIAVTDIFLTITTAIPCGLIINELVTNALKHAFPQEQDGTITVSMTPSTNDHLILTVSDTGIGFPKEIDFRNTTTLGMQLVTSLVEQLDGTITLDRSEGTTFTITFRGGVTV